MKAKNLKTNIAAGVKTHVMVGAYMMGEHESDQLGFIPTLEMFWDRFRLDVVYADPGYDDGEHFEAVAARGGVAVIKFRDAKRRHPQRVPHHDAQLQRFLEDETGYLVDYHVRSLAETVDSTFIRTIASGLVGQLLARGVELGLFMRATADRKAGTALTVAQVRRAARQCVRGAVASRLRVDQTMRERRLGAILYEELPRSRAARKARTRARIVVDIERLALQIGHFPRWLELGMNLKQRVKTNFGTFDGFLAAQAIDKSALLRFGSQRFANASFQGYLALAAKIGRNPPSADVGSSTGLFRRIFKYFGTFEAFLDTAHVRPNYVKRTWRERAVARLDTALC